MNPMSVILWSVLGVLAVIVLYIIVTFNSLISLRNRVANAWSQIDVQLKRRYDLIPNLINTVKGYMKHEKGVLTEVTKMRSNLVSGSMSDKSKASDAISNALKTIFAVAESYPKLQASENFKMLQEELSGTESKIAYSRQFYNDNVMTLNNKIQQFPSNVIAGMLKFTQREFFKTEESERKPVKVEF
ncbi:LemA family protein [Candidatus Woesearchaeota archaeon]|nr:LemA family protein [Candidatus Woesearchaeota archaeon]